MDQFLHTFSSLIVLPLQQGAWVFLLKFVPFVVFFEMPVYLMIVFGALHYSWKRDSESPAVEPYSPAVTCIITCFDEGIALKRTVLSLGEQLYQGQIQIIAVVDGASDNAQTLSAAREMQKSIELLPFRRMQVVPKWKRGGRVSSLNAGLSMATGDIVLAVDGDTSFDNTMLQRAVMHFKQPNVVGVAGNLRVRNVRQSLMTRFQALEYLLSISLARTGLNEFNAVNNISGAFGIFRKDFLSHIGGWDTGTAEDLDLTLRIKNYFARYPGLRIRFEPEAVGHTDAPSTLAGFLRQRLRWEGDLYYLYIRKHRLSFSPGLIGWTNFIAQTWTGIFFQLVMPLIILMYVSYSLFTLPTGYLLAVWAVVYLFYLATTWVFYAVFMVLMSERPSQDIKLAPMTVIFPVINMGVRLWSALATLRELVMYQHLDTAMAPWWVLRKSKF
jgi:cellulose synthase/poly-beta-1,6-N-acetylglucosamine synthase-like glycosyltransferase